MIDEIGRARAYLNYKQSIIRQMASRGNDVSLDAAHITADEGWLKDGSLEGADLYWAHLEGVHYDRYTIWPDGFTPPPEP